MLSIIVPAYKQEKTIYQDLISILGVLDSLNREYELLLVVDGEVDDTKTEAQKVTHPRLMVYSYPQNQGKGYAVRFGMSKAQGDVIGFIDAGTEIDPQGIIMALAHLDWYQADVIVGSKQHPVAQVRYPLKRRLLSLIYWFLVRLGVGLRVRDTQTGLKLYRREVLDKVLPRLIVNHFSFDIEMLSVAHRLGHTRIFESPVRLTYNFEDVTHASTWRSIFKMLYDTLAVIYRLRLLRFYDDHQAHRWPKHGLVLG